MGEKDEKNYFLYRYCYVLCLVVLRMQPETNSLVGKRRHLGSI